MPSMKYKKIKIYIQRAKIFVPMSLCRGGWWRTWSCPCCHPGSWLAGRVSGDWARTGPSWLFPVPSSPHQPSWVQRSETRARWQGRADHARPARPPPSLVRPGWRSALAGTRLAPRPGYTPHTAPWSCRGGGWWGTSIPAHYANAAFCVLISEVVLENRYKELWDSSAQPSPKIVTEWCGWNPIVAGVADILHGCYPRQCGGVRRLVAAAVAAQCSAALPRMRPGGCSLVCRARPGSGHQEEEF